MRCLRPHSLGPLGPGRGHLEWVLKWTADRLRGANRLGVSGRWAVAYNCMALAGMDPIYIGKAFSGLDWGRNQ